MNKSWFYLGIIGSLAVLTTSCGGDSGKPAATPATSPSAVASPAAAVPPTVPAPPTATTPAPPVAAAPPIVPGTATAAKPVSVDVAAGLIAPTNADNWAKTVLKGRADPFATLTLQPVEVAEKDPLDGTGKPQKASSKIASNSSSAAKSGVNKPLPSIKTDIKVTSNSSTVATTNPTHGSKTTYDDSYISRIPRSGVNRNLPKLKVAFKPDAGSISISSQKPTVGLKSLDHRTNSTSNQKSIVSLKPLPQPLKALSNGSGTVAPAISEPKLARTVGISGVIQLGGRTQVIVKLPNESFSRYVEVGDRIYEGKIKVKRVEGEQTLSPIVVLEEVGVEVTRRVGDTVDVVSKEAQPK
jgi:hypothetical protein